MSTAAKQAAMLKAIQTIDAALAPLEAADRRTVAHMLTNLERPGMASSLARMLPAVIAALPPRAPCVIYQFKGKGGQP